MEPSDPCFAKPYGDAGAYRDLLQWRGLRFFLHVLKSHWGHEAERRTAMGRGHKAVSGWDPEYPARWGWSGQGLVWNKRERQHLKGVVLGGLTKTEFRVQDTLSTGRTC